MSTPEDDVRRMCAEVHYLQMCLSIIGIVYAVYVIHTVSQTLTTIGRDVQLTLYVRDCTGLLDRDPIVVLQSQEQLAKRLRKRGLSYRQIADRLEAEGMRPRSGGRWHPPMVSRLVNGEARRSPP